MIEPSHMEGAEAESSLRVVEERPAKVHTPTLTIVDTDDGTGTDWVLDCNRRRGEALLERLQGALRRGRARHADRLRTEFLGVVHQDRIAAACLAARDAGLLLEPVGHGDVLDRPGPYQLRRTPWRVRPLTATDGAELPEHARHARAVWGSQPMAFDALYEATEAPDLGGMPADPRPPKGFLIGVISADGLTGDWFVLADWEA